MFILTITDAEGVSYVEAFREMKQVRAFVPPAWAKLKAPTKRTAVLFSENCAIAGEFVGETIHV